MLFWKKKMSTVLQRNRNQRLYLRYLQIFSAIVCKHQQYSALVNIQQLCNFGFHNHNKQRLYMVASTTKLPMHSAATANNLQSREKQTFLRVKAIITPS